MDDFQTVAPNGELPLECAQRIDTICEKFEALWQEGKLCRIEDELSAVSGLEREHLLIELLAIELEYRIRSEDYPTTLEYVRRFPAHVTVVNDAFATAVSLEYESRLKAGEVCTLEDILRRHPDLRLRYSDIQTLSSIGHQHRLAKPNHAPYDTSQNANATSTQLLCPRCHTPLSGPVTASMRCTNCDGRLRLGEQPSRIGRRIGQFELVDILGQGKFGTVYRAHDAVLGRDVAVKIPNAGILDSGQEERFLREARSAAQLSHPGIVAVHQIEQADGTIFIVSDLVEGVSLDAHLMERGHALPAREAVELCADIGDALEHAHSMGVIHRDLKPSNIIIDGQCKPRILDFGLAKVDVDEVTMTVDGHILGTPAYMPPEQARGESHEATARSDLYSLGVILFELLTAEIPFRGDLSAVLDQIVTVEAPSPRVFNPTIARDLETICLRCLEKSPDDRFESCGDLAADLRRFLNGEPVVARPIGRLTRAVRWTKRHPLVSALASLLLIATVTSVVLASSLQLRVEELAKAREDLSGQVAALNKAKRLARAQVASLLTSQAETRVRQESEIAGRRIDGLRLVADAATAVNETGADSLVAPLRQTAFHALSLFDLKKGHEQQIGPRASVSFASDHTRMAIARPDGTLVVSDLADMTEVWRRPDDEVESTFMATSFSPDGRYLGARLHLKTSGIVSEIWDLSQNKRMMQQRVWMSPYSFHPQDNMVALSAVGGITLWDIVQAQTHSEIWTGFAPGAIRFSPNGKWVAAAHPDDPWVGIYEIETKELVTRIDYPAVFDSLAWSSDSLLLSCGSGSGEVRVVKRTNGQLFAEMAGHSGHIIRCQFLADTYVVVSTAVDGRTVVWDTLLGNDKVVLPGIDFEVHRNGESVTTLDGETVTVWELTSSNVDRVLPTGLHASSTQPNTFNTFRTVGYTPDGELMFASGLDGISFFDRDGTKVATLTNKQIQKCQTALFHPRDKSLYTHSQTALFRWPFDVSNRGTHLRLTIGKGELLRPGDGSGLCAMAISPDGRIAVGNGVEGAVEIFDPNNLGNAKKYTAPEGGPFGLAIDPKGDWMVAGGWGAPEIKVWNLRNEQLAHRLRSGDSATAFTGVSFAPNGRWLVTTASDSARSTVTFWAVGSWQREESISGTKLAAPGPPVFSPDGRIMAVALAGDQIALYQVEPLTKIAHITTRDSARMAPASFSADGQTLLLASERDYFHEWNLAGVEDWLEQHHLQWGDYFPAAPQHPHAPRKWRPRMNAAPY